MTSVPRPLVFLADAADSAAAEKDRFYESQVRRLGAMGIESRIVRAGSAGDPPPAEAVVVFDVAERDSLAPYLGAAAILAPLVWNDYVFWRDAWDWIRGQAKVQAVLACSPISAEILASFPLRRPVLCVRPTFDLDPRAIGCAEAVEGRPTVIGWLKERETSVRFVRAGLLGRRPDLLRIAWRELSFADRDGWRTGLAECTHFLAVRRLASSALPLVEAMAAGLAVVAGHGGGLTEVASEANGYWQTGAEPDSLIDLLERALSDEPALVAERRAKRRAARISAMAVTADRCFAENLAVWRSLVTEA